MTKTNLSDSVNSTKDLEQATSAAAAATGKPRIGLKVRTRIKAGTHFGDVLDGGDGGGNDRSPPGNHGLKVRTAL